MTSILSLNQDCLNEIFEYLTIYELIDIEETCSEFKYTCEVAYKSKRFRALKIELRYLKVNYLDAIFDRVAKHLRSFEFSGGYIMDEMLKQTIFEVISDRCTNLEKLTLNYVQFTNDQFQELKKKCFPQLTYLDLSRCNINENHLDCLDGDKLTKIKTLKLSGNAGMSGEFFKTMNNVEVLVVSFCFGLRYFMFRQFLKNCNNLLELDISASSSVVPEDLDIVEEILKYQPNIVKLIMENIGIDENPEIFSKFKHLKHFSTAGRKFGL